MLVGHRGPVRKAEFATDGSSSRGSPTGRSASGTSGTSVELVGSPETRAGRAPPAVTISPDGARAREADGDVDPPADAVGREASAARAQGRREQRRVQPRRPLLVSAGRDHDVIVWDVATGEEAFRHRGGASRARSRTRGSAPTAAGSSRPARSRHGLWTADGQPPGRYLYGPKPPVTRGRLRRPTRARSSRASATVSCGAGNASSAAGSTNSRARRVAAARDRRKLTATSGPLPRLTARVEPGCRVPCRVTAATAAWTT